MGFGTRAMGKMGKVGKLLGIGTFGFFLGIGIGVLFSGDGWEK